MEFIIMLINVNVKAINLNIVLHQMLQLRTNLFKNVCAVKNFNGNNFLKLFK